MSGTYRLDADRMTTAIADATFSSGKVEHPNATQIMKVIWVSNGRVEMEDDQGHYEILVRDKPSG